MWYTDPNFYPSRSLDVWKERPQSFSFFPHMEVTTRNLHALQVRENPSPHLLKICLHLNSISSPSDLIHFSLDTLMALTGACSGSFLAWDEFQKALVLRAVRHAERESILGTKVKLGEGVAGQIAEQGKSVLVLNIQNDDRFSDVKRSGSYDTPSFLGLPLVANNKLVGLINLTEKEDKANFTDLDLDLSEMVSEMVATAYDRLRFESRLKNENEVLAKKVLELQGRSGHEDRLVSIGKYAADIAHDVTNPLDGVRRFVNLALDQIEEDSLAREYLLKAKKGMRQALQVLRGLLAYSRENGKPRYRKSDLHTLLTEAIQMSREDRSFSGISFEMDFSTQHIVVDGCGLQGVFQNLFQNARDAMKGEGVLRIETKQSNGRAVVSVQDQGIGISEETKEHVFEPFFTTKTNGEGTGLGLSICREIVKRCGGDINFYSQVDQGTEFTISLPRFNEEEGA
jgi:signal transduction histidine kinase